jgi:hypothetical protein
MSFKETLVLYGITLVVFFLIDMMGPALDMKPDADIKPSIQI